MHRGPADRSPDHAGDPRESGGPPSDWPSQPEVVTAGEFASALREREEGFRRLADAMPQLVWTANPDGRVDYYNARWREYSGISPAAGGVEPSWDWAPTLHPDDEAATIQAWRRAVETGRPYQIEHRVRMADGSVRWHLSRGIPRRDADGRIIKWYGTATDIHDFRVAQESARLSEERYRLVARATNDVIWDWDLRSNQISWSEATLANLGCTAEQIGNSFANWRERVHPEDRARLDTSIQAAIASGGDTWSDEYRFRRQDGSYGVFLDRGHIARDPSGRAYRMIGSLLDITERRRNEAELRQARDDAERASRAKDEFLAALSHELRTPLTPVLVMTQMLEQEKSFTPEVRDDLRTIRRNVELEIRLIDDLLDLTRITRGKLRMNEEVVDVHRVLLDAVRIGCDDTCRQKRLRVRCELDATRSAVRGDAARLGQVFWNLIKNAVKFTPEDGAITLHTRNPSPAQLEISVSDTGIGIEAAALPQIFNAFEQGGAHITRRFGGLGLGLAIGRAVVELHHGTITARSEGTGRGAEFILELPTCADAASREAEPISAGSPVVHGPAGSPRKRILLVEDHAHSANALARLLQRTGYDVAIAASVQEALQLASQSTFDLLVSDLGLPDGSGNDLMRELQRRYGLRGIALSGFGMEEDMVRSREAGFEGHLVKPVRTQHLIAMIQNLPERTR